MCRSVVALLTVALAVTARGGEAHWAASAAREASIGQGGLVASPCSGRRARPTGWRVVVVVLENHSYSQIARSSPYLNRLAHRCALASGYSALKHPSLPNYLALTSGTTSGITSDCTVCTVSVRSIFEQLHGDWRSYLESMPSPGFIGAFSGLYAKKHNPAAYYTGIARDYPRHALPLGSVDDGALARDLRHGTLRRFSLIIPNLCNDEHDCPITTGDRWLRTWIPLILNSPVYARGQTLLVITYDEGTDSDNHVYTVAVSRSIGPGTILRAPLTHYSLLKTTQQLLGLRCLAHACDTKTTSMIPVLHY
jgi:phospholipase C